MASPFCWENWLIDGAHKLYVWGRSGHGAKSGYALSSLNYHTGYTRVLSGSGGNNLVDGIIHSDSLNVRVVTYQYDLYDQTGTISLGQVPRLDSLGCNISVFGDYIKITSVQENPVNLGINCNIFPNPAKNKAKIQIFIDKPSIIKINIFDLLGNKYNSFNDNEIYSGIQTFNLYLNSLAAGIYFVKIEMNNEIKIEKLIIFGD